MEIHHFEYGLLNPALAFGTSVAGSLMGLATTARLRETTNPRHRAWLLVVAALAIGGVGIWAMHFIAMIGFAVPRSALRYDAVMTVASFVLAILFVGVGLFIVGFGRLSALRVFLGGTITGVSVGFMHYTGMAAMRLHGTIDSDTSLVLGSYAIAVVGAIVALWFALMVRGAVATIGAALLMGVAVTAMHYTGMAAVRVRLHDDLGNLGGFDNDLFLAPIVLFVMVVAMLVASTMMATMSEQVTSPERDKTSRPGAKGSDADILSDRTPYLQLVASSADRVAPRF